MLRYGRSRKRVMNGIPNWKSRKDYWRELANILFDSTNNNKLKYVSITKVSLTNDLSIATVYYTVLGNLGEIESTKEDLEKSKGYLRSILAKRIDLRKTPELRFKYDESLAYGNHINEILENLKK